MSSTTPTSSIDFAAAFPNSQKVYVEEHGLRVPMREITLSGGAPPLRVYDTSGPQGHDLTTGLPKLRRGWARPRPSGAITQLAYARRHEITPEMQFVALREGLDAEFVRSEVAGGRARIPSDNKHPEHEPMFIGRNDRG
jgi:phosphomethylpyrimidine synthase